MKYFKSVVLFLAITSLVSTSVAFADSVEMSPKNVQESIEPHADIIDWVYKVENGKLYKRKYNFSKGEYVGSWMLA